MARTKRVYSKLFYGLPACEVWKSVLQLSHHFSRMVKQPDSTLLIFTEILRVPKGYLGCFDSKSHYDRHYVSEKWGKLAR